MLGGPNFLNELNARQEKERPPTDFSDCDEMYLYNATQTSPFSKYYLLLDVRERALFDKSCIYYAVHLDINKADDLSKVSNLAKELACSKKNALKYIDSKRVIIYTHNAADRAKATEKLHALQELLKLKDKVTNCRVLSSGFEEFAAKYPFMVVTDVKTKLPRYPHEIVQDRLFLGDGQQATRQEIVQNLKITHIANISREIPCAFKEDGIKYIEVRIQDKEEEDISVHFEKVIQFIMEALQATNEKQVVQDSTEENKDNEEEDAENANRVLVHCEYGISRSSSMVIAYLMTVNKWDFETAKKDVQSKRRQISPNDGFVVKLKEYEKTIL